MFRDTAPWRTASGATATFGRASQYAAFGKLQREGRKMRAGIWLRGDHPQITAVPRLVDRGEVLLLIWRRTLPLPRILTSGIAAFPPITMRAEVTWSGSTTRFGDRCRIVEVALRLGQQEYILTATGGPIFRRRGHHRRLRPDDHLSHKPAIGLQR